MIHNLWFKGPQVKIVTTFFFPQCYRGLSYLAVNNNLVVRIPQVKLKNIVLEHQIDEIFLTRNDVLTVIITVESPNRFSLIFSTSCVPENLQHIGQIWLCKLLVTRFGSYPSKNKL